MTNTNENVFFTRVKSRKFQGVGCTYYVPSRGKRVETTRLFIATDCHVRITSEAKSDLREKSNRITAETWFKIAVKLLARGSKRRRKGSS